jgi:WD40 repeat protein
MMNNNKSFSQKTFVKIFAPEWFRLKLFYSTHLHYCRQKIISEALRIKAIPIMVLILLSSCNTTLSKDIQAGSTPTLPSAGLSLRLISNQNISNLEPIKEWEIYDINDIAWSINSSMFAIAGEENDDGIFGVSAFNIDASEMLWFHETYVPFSLVFSPDNQVIAVPFFAGINLLNTTTGQSVKEILYQKETCFGSMGIRFSPDGTKIFTLRSSPDSNDELTEIFIWDIEMDRCLGKLVEEKGVAFNFELSHDGRFLILGLHDIEVQGHFEQQVHVWNVETQQQVCSFAGTHPVFSLGGEWIAAANVENEGEVDLWSTRSCQRLDGFQSTEQKIPRDISFSPDGQLLAIGGDTLQIWRVASKELLFESDQLSNHVDFLTFSPDGRFLLMVTPRISGNDKGKIVLWGVVP